MHIPPLTRDILSDPTASKADKLGFVFMLAEIEATHTLQIEGDEVHETVFDLLTRVIKGDKETTMDYIGYLCAAAGVRFLPYHAGYVHEVVADLIKDRAPAQVLPVLQKADLIICGEKLLRPQPASLFTRPREREDGSVEILLTEDGAAISIYLHQEHGRDIQGLAKALQDKLAVELAGILKLG